jgi:hypothetical protein
MIANLQPSKLALLASGLAAAIAVAWLQRDSNDSLASIEWTDAPLQTEVYVWQRTWTPAVKESIAELAAESPGYCALGLEFGFDREGNIEGIQATKLDWDLAARLAGEKRFSVAVRVHQNRAGWAPNSTSAACDEIVKLAAKLTERGISPAELQIDYDCPQSKLGDYAKFLTELRDRLPSQKLTITTLPSWLGEADFPTLADATDGYVLQVHSLSLPEPGEPEGVALCDTKQAIHDIQRAARIGRPFRVALPSYSSIVLFDAGGEVVDVVSEDLNAPTHSYQRAEFAHADEGELAELVAELDAKHPSALKGIIWYRLPIESDRMNWPMAAFRKIVAGEAPTVKSGIELRTDPSNGAVGVVFVNSGETAVSLPAQVRVNATSITSFDALAGYECSLAEDRSGALIITAPPAMAIRRLRPGEEIHLAWLRHEAGTLAAHIE